MKQHFLLLSIVALFLCSCSNQDDVGLLGSLDSSAVAVAESDKVSADDIFAIASKFRNTENTRTRSNDYSTSILFDNNLKLPNQSNVLQKRTDIYNIYPIK